MRRVKTRRKSRSRCCSKRACTCASCNSTRAWTRTSILRNTAQNVIGRWWRRAGGYFHWLADRIRARYGAGDAEQRTEGFKALLPAIQRIPDKLERAAVANEMAEYLNVERSLVLEQFRSLPRRTFSGAEAAGEKPAVPALEQILLKALLADGAVRAAIPAAVARARRA